MMIESSIPNTRIQMKEPTQTVQLIDLLVSDATKYIEKFAAENHLDMDEALVRIVGQHRTQQRINATADLNEGADNDK